MEAVFLIYGLSFFILGFCIFIYPKKDTGFAIAGSLWMIAAFGFAHGINEWLDLLALIRPEIKQFLKTISFLVLPASYYFLLLFGVRSRYDPPAGRGYANGILNALPVVLPAGWATLVLFSPDRLLMGDIWARYLLGAPGTMLASYALLSHLPEFRRTRAEAASTGLKLSAWGFIAYAVFSGLVVPRGPFFPASAINYSAFTYLVGIPVQVFRTACALVIAVGMIRLLYIFEWEKVETLKEAHGLLEQRVNERTAWLRELNDELENEISRRSHAEESLLNSLGEKEVLLREIHHRVKNNMQIISSLLKMESSRSGDPEKSAVLEESQNRIRSMALVHDQLYQSDNLRMIDCQGYISKLARDLMVVHKVDANKVLADIQATGVSVDIETAVPCGLLINELLSNAFKYAFPGGRSGTVRVSLNRTGKDSFALEVQDNGVGLPEGLVPRESSSLGFQLIFLLAEKQMRGKVDVQSGADGTHYRMTCSKPGYARRARSA